MSHHVQWETNSFEGKRSIAANGDNAPRPNHRDQCNQQWPSGLPLRPCVTSVGHRIIRRVGVQRKHVPQNGGYSDTREDFPDNRGSPFRHQRAARRSIEIDPAQERAGLIQMDFVGQR